MGADIVSIGRPSIWGLILSGNKGVSKIIDLFYNELKSVMGLSGCNDIKKLKPEIYYKMNLFVIHQFPELIILHQLFILYQRNKMF